MKDTEFIRGNIPMTKEEIRTIVLSKLALNADDTLFDIGAGTGSLAIEAATVLTKGKVLAIEQKEEAIALINKNIHKHKLTNIEVRHAKAPDGMHDINKANKFFIGGSGGNLIELLMLITSETSTDAIIVVNAIVLDTMYKAYRFFKDNNFDFEVIQVQINKVNTESKVAMFQGQNPIFILTAQKK